MKLIRLASFTFIAFVISISVFNPSSFAANYYVKNGGNDSADGKSDATAWKTIAKVNAFAKSTGFKNGDTINLKRGCTWSNNETLGMSNGHSVDWGIINGLTIQSYGSGSKPRLDANTQKPIHIVDSDGTAAGIVNLTIKDIDVSGSDHWNSTSYSGTNITISSVTNITVDGIYMNGHTGATKYMPVIGISIGDPFGNVEIKNCEIFNNIGKNRTLRSWSPNHPDVACIVCRDNLIKQEGTIKIHDNVLHDAESDCIQLAGMLTNTKIYNNKFYHFGENGLDFKGCDGVEIYDNEMYRGSYGLGGTGGGLGNIVFHDFTSGSPGYCKNAIIRDNYFHTTDYIGLRLINATDFNIFRNTFKNCTNGIQMVTNSRVHIYNNVFDLAEGVPSSAALDAGVYVPASYQNDSQIYNNTFYIGKNHRYGMYIRKGGLSIKNNIFYCERNNADTYPIRTSDNAKPTMGTNCYYNPNHTNRVNWNGVVYNSSKLQQFRNDIDSGAIFSDPVFKNPSAGDFSLRSSSPCILPSGIKLGVLDAFAADFLTTQPSTASFGPPSNLRIQ